MHKRISTLINLTALTCAAYLFLVLPAGFAQQDGLTLLTKAGQRYSGAKIYHIKKIEETTTTTELSRDWQKTLFTAIQGTDNRFRFETQSSSGSSFRTSDGKTETVYHPEDHQYTQHPASPDGPTVGQEILSEVDLVEFESIKSIKTLAGLADEYSAAQLLPDATITLDSRPVACYVVKLNDKDLKKASKPGTG